MWLQLHLQVEVDLLSEKDRHIAILLVDFTCQGHVTDQEDPNGDAPSDDLAVGNIDFWINIIVLQEFVAEIADIDEGEHECRADNAINASLGSSASQECTNTKPCLDVPDFVKSEMGNLGPEGSSGGGDMGKQLGCQEPSLECPFSNRKKEEK